jgi:hypothetical protein
MHIATEGWNDSSYVFDQEHFLVFYNLIVVYCCLLTGVVYENGNHERDDNPNHLGLSSRFTGRLKHRDIGLGLRMRLGKFDLLQLELFHFLLSNL